MSKIVLACVQIKLACARRYWSRNHAVRAHCVERFHAVSAVRLCGMLALEVAAAVRQNLDRECLVGGCLDVTRTEIIVSVCQSLGGAHSL